MKEEANWLLLHWKTLIYKEKRKSAIPFLACGSSQFAMPYKSYKLYNQQANKAWLIFAKKNISDPIITLILPLHLHILRISLIFISSFFLSFLQEATLSAAVFFWIHPQTFQDQLSNKVPWFLCAFSQHTHTQMALIARKKINLLPTSSPFFVSKFIVGTCNSVKPFRGEDEEMLGCFIYCLA